jgi:hypothetical protein
MRKYSQKDIFTIEATKADELVLVRQTTEYVAHDLGITNKHDIYPTDCSESKYLELSINATGDTIKEFSTSYSAALKLLRKKAATITDAVKVCEDFGLTGDLLDSVSDNMFFNGLTLREALKLESTTNEDDLIFFEQQREYRD